MSRPIVYYPKDWSVSLPEKVALLTDLTAMTYQAPPVTWCRLEVVSRTQTPHLASVSPTILTTMPVPATQTLTIYGSGFSSATRLVFTTGTTTYASRPERLQLIDANTLKYDIAVGSAVGTWTVRLADGTGSATFQVQLASSGLHTVTPLSGPHGSITPSAPLSKASGESQTFVATPQDSSFTVDMWYVDGVAVPATGNRFTLGNIQASHIVFVTFKVATTSAQTGSLAVTLQPSGAVTAGAQWQLDAGAYRNNGDIVTDLAIGSHTLSFKSVAGYTAPATRSVTITAGLATGDSGTYTLISANTYKLTVNSDHGGVARNPEKAAYSPGETVRLMAYPNDGWHFDHWSGDVSGPLSFTDVVMDGNKTVTANYALGDWSVGALSVTIEPSGARAAGARWRDNAGPWTNSGVTLNDAFIGNHYIEFSDVPPWKKPNPLSVPVAGGATTNVVATYAEDSTPGTLIVCLTPSDAVTAGAKWRVSGVDPQNNGAPISLGPGNYTVSFEPVSGWATPASQPVTIRAGQTTLANGNYAPATAEPVIGSIRPSLGAIAGGTLVTVDGANFVPPVSVKIDDKEAMNVTIVNSTRVTCLTPPQPTYKKTVPVSVQAAGGNTTSSNGFTYGAVRGTNLNLQTQLGGAVTTAAVQGNYAFIGQGSRLVVLNILDLSNPVPVGNGLQFAGLVNNIKLVGNFLYIANGEEGLQVVDVAKPTEPVLVGTFTTEGTAQSVAVLGGRAYVAVKQAGLHIVDVSEPANLRLLGSVPTEGWAFDVAVNVSAHGVFAYVANLFGTLKVVNVTAPASASVVGSLSIGGNLYSVTYAANRVYVGGFEQCVIVGIGSDTNLTTLGSFSSGAGPGIAYANGYLFTLGMSGFHIVDVANPLSPTEVGSVLGFSATPLSQITLVGSTAYVCAWADGFRIIDASSRTVPTQRGQYRDFVGYAGGLALANNSLFVANRNKLEVLDVVDPLAPARRSPFSPAGQPLCVSTSGNRTYITEGNLVQIVDASNPQDVLGTIQPTMTTIGDFYVVGGLGYMVSQAMADGWNPILAIYDISQPSSPVLRSSIRLLPSDATGNASGLVVRGNLAYVVLRSTVGLRIVDVSSSGAPQLRGFLTGLDYANSVTLTSDGAYAVVVCDTGLRIIDVRDPDNPQLVSAYSQGGVSAEIVGDLAYLAAGSAGVQVLDISDRANPRLVRSYNTPEYACALTVNGSTLYVADGYGGVLVLTIPDTEPPGAFIINPVFAALSPVITNTTSTMNLGGAAFDNVCVTRIAWSNSRGGGGEADGTDNWFVANVALRPGTNILSVSAFDAAGNNGSDALTVVYQPPKQNQTITFPAIADRRFGDPPFPLTAAASSSLPVSFSVSSGPASLVDNVLTLLGAGEVAIQANQAGSELFNPALPANVHFVAGKADQAIAFAALPDRSPGDLPFPLAATASSGLPVSFSIASGPAAVNSNIVSLLGGGRVTVSAWQLGNSNFNAAGVEQRSFNVSKLAQTISFGPLSAQTLGDAPFPLAATASSGLPVSFNIASGPAMVRGQVIALLGWGTVTVRASQAGNGSYAAATDVVQSFFVSPAGTALAGPQFLHNGGFQMAFYGSIGSNYQLQASTGLTNWVPVVTFLCTNSPTIVVDPAATNHGRRFYRTLGQ